MTDAQNVSAIVSKRSFSHNEIAPCRVCQIRRRYDVWVDIESVKIGLSKWQLFNRTQVEHSGDLQVAENQDLLGLADLVSSLGQGGSKTWKAIGDLAREAVKKARKDREGGRDD